MTTRPELRLALDGSPPVVAFTRAQIDFDPWYQIVLQFSDSRQRIAESFGTPPTVFLQHKARLKQILRAHGIDLVVDDRVREMLSASNSDVIAFREARTGSDHSIGPAVDSRYEVKRQLRAPFQVRDFDRLARVKHGANFSVPGAGKTTVALAVHASARNAGLVKKMLVVAPYSAFGAWEEDGASVLEPAPVVTRWRPGTHPSGDIVLVAYQQLHAATSYLTEWLLTEDVHLVIDEAHRAKRGATGEWGRILLQLAPFAVRRDILTGTPAPNRPSDLAPLLDILWPGANASAILPRRAFGADPPESAMSEVQNAIAPLYVRTNKSELGLPEIRIRREPVPMGPAQAQIYAALRDQYQGSLALDNADAATMRMMGEVTMYLLQAASSPRLLAGAVGPQAYRFPPLAIPEGSRLAGLIETYADHEVPAKFATACRIVLKNAQEGRKTLLWSNFPANLLDLEIQLAALEPAVVYGATPTDTEAARSRDAELLRFKTDEKCMVLLANPAVLAEGVSLHHECHDAVYLDRTFNAGQYLQSLDRIHRLGLSSEIETRVTLLVAGGTIDERVDARVEMKTRRLSRILNDGALVRMALPDDDDPGGFYDEEADLVDVLEYLAGGPRLEPVDGHQSE